MGMKNFFILGIKLDWIRCESVESRVICCKIYNILNLYVVEKLLLVEELLFFLFLLRIL